MAVPREKPGQGLGVRGIRKGLAESLGYGPFGKNCNTGLLEEVSDTTTEEYSAHEVRAFGHRLEFAARQVFEFAFGLGLMGFQFLMLQMIPDLFIGIPVGRVFR